MDGITASQSGGGGCRGGENTLLLTTRYPHAQLIAFEENTGLSAYAKDIGKQVNFLQASPGMLPLPNDSVDLIFANLVLPWSANMSALFFEWQRILRTGGLLMFSCLGPDTLREIHAPSIQVPHLIDMHNAGDALIQTGLSHPVLDVEYFTLTYSDRKKLFHELTVTGMAAGDFEQLHLTPHANQFTITYEVVYGHAWKEAARESGGPAEFKIPLSKITKLT